MERLMNPTGNTVSLHNAYLHCKHTNYSRERSVVSGEVEGRAVFSNSISANSYHRLEALSAEARAE